MVVDAAVVMAMIVFVVSVAADGNVGGGLADCIGRGDDIMVLVTQW